MASHAKVAHRSASAKVGYPFRQPRIALGATLEHKSGVSARAEQLALARLRWLLFPLAGLAVVATVVEVVRRRATQPAVSPMSDEWLREHTSVALE